MKMFTVSALVCAMMLLTGAAGSHLVKRSYSTGWFQFGGRWFYFVPQRMNWIKAEKNCQSLGGNLASIHNLQEYRQIQRLTKLETWIGGSNAQEANQWLWTDGTPFNFNHWCPQQPSDKGRGVQQCLQMNYRAEKCWDDLECSAQRPSLCAVKNC